MSGEIEALLDAAETALIALRTAGTVKTVERMADKGESYEDQLARVGRLPPFLVLVYEGGPWKEINEGQRLYLHSPSLTVLMGITSLAGRASASTGLLTIQDAVLGALAGQKLSLAIEPLTPGPTELVTWSKGFTVYGLRFATRLPVTVGGA